MKWMCILAVLGIFPSMVAAQSPPTDFVDNVVVSGLSIPVGIAWLPDGRLLVIEQKTADIRLIVNETIGPTLGKVDAVNTAGGERGLLGIAVDPGWPTRPYVYIHCTSSSPAAVRVSRYTVTGDLSDQGSGTLSMDPATRYDLINDIPDVRANHQGGTVRFGGDGMLYVSFGEDDTDDLTCHAQDLTGLRGQILRLDVTRLPAGSGGPPPRALITPQPPNANPFYANPDSNAKLVWNYGLRNPFRFHIDTDGALFIADVGELSWEEVNRTTAGANLGWPRWEANREHTPSCAAVGALAPIYSYGRGDGRTVVSAGVYRAPAGAMHPFPAEYEGDYFFSDYYTGFLRRLKGSGQSWSIAPPVAGQGSGADWATGYASVSDYLIGPEGRLWYCRQFVSGSNSGQIRRIAYSPPPDTLPPAPGAASFARPFPSPAVAAVNLSYTLTRTSRVNLRIYDGRGALVRTLVPNRIQTANQYDLIWNGRDDEGRDAPAGLYFARLEVDGQAMKQRIPMLR